jgi:hypothetical protein
MPELTGPAARITGAVSLVIGLILAAIAFLFTGGSLGLFNK